MKGQAELNALLLLTDNYHRLDKIRVEVSVDTIEVSGVPKPLLEHFAEEINGVVAAERRKALELVEQAAKKYVAAIE